MKRSLLRINSKAKDAKQLNLVEQSAVFLNDLAKHPPVEVAYFSVPLAAGLQFLSVWLSLQGDLSQIQARLTEWIIGGSIGWAAFTTVGIIRVFKNANDVARFIIGQRIS